MVKKIMDPLTANPELFATTVLFITMDEGGGFYDSGYIQPLDFFGDGPRIPLIAVSPFSTGGHISHTLHGSCLDPEIHRAQLGSESAHRAQPRQFPQSARR